MSSIEKKVTDALSEYSNDLVQEYDVIFTESEEMLTWEIVSYNCKDSFQDIVKFTELHIYSVVKHVLQLVLNDQNLINDCQLTHNASFAVEKIAQTNDQHPIALTTKLTYQPRSSDGRVDANKVKNLASKYLNQRTDLYLVASPQPKDPNVIKEIEDEVKNLENLFQKKAKTLKNGYNFISDTSYGRITSNIKISEQHTSNTKPSAEIILLSCSEKKDLDSAREALVNVMFRHFHQLSRSISPDKSSGSWSDCKIQLSFQQIDGSVFNCYNLVSKSLN